MFTRWFHLKSVVFFTLCGLAGCTKSSPIQPRPKAKQTTDGKTSDSLQALCENPFAVTYTNIEPMLSSCQECHSDGNFVIKTYFDPSHDPKTQKDYWDKVYKSIVTRYMPPGNPWPDDDIAKLGIWLQDSSICQSLSFKGMPRLTRQQFGRTISDLFGVGANSGNELPVEFEEQGFVNLTNLQMTSQELSTAILRVSEKIADSFIDLAPSNSQYLTVVTCDITASDWRSCLGRIISDLLPRAYRRPSNADEIGRLKDFVSQAENGREALKLTIMAIINSPNFLYRIEDNDFKDNLRRLNGFELVSRLSYFLWGTMPDSILFSLAEDDRILNDDILANQVDRMLTDRKADFFIENFADSWFQLNKVMLVTQVDQELRTAMVEETRSLLKHAIRSNQSIMYLLDSDDLFLNKLLSEHYGIGFSQSREIEKISRSSEQRFGLLTQGSFLTATSNANETSPVRRGKWVMENVLCISPPAPPADVDAELEAIDSFLPIREKMAAHTQNATCASCHALMDEIGFGLENFSPTGKWQTMSHGFPVDSAGSLPAKGNFSNHAELIKLLTNDDQFPKCVAQKLYAYAFGRIMEQTELNQLAEFLDPTKESEYKLQDVIKYFVLSKNFRYRIGE